MVRVFLRCFGPQNPAAYKRGLTASDPSLLKFDSEGAYNAVDVEKYKSYK